MKVGVIGAGAVGRACVLSMLQRGSCREIVLTNRTRGRAAGAATDMRYGRPLSPPVDVIDGEYEDLVGADLVMITAGANEQSGGATDRDDSRGRLRLLDDNADVYREVIPQIVDASPDAVLLVVTDPPDPLTDITRQLAGHDRVFGTGTLIDSLRLRVHIGQQLRVVQGHRRGYLLPYPRVPGWRPVDQPRAGGVALDGAGGPLDRTVPCGQRAAPPALAAALPPRL